LRICTRICLCLLLLAPLAVYWQTVFHEYGFKDDYSLPREAHEEPGKVLRLTASSGRPVYGIVLQTTLEAVYAVEDLQWLRLIGVMLLTLVGFALWRVLRRAGWSDIEAATIGLAIVLLPASQVTAAWAISWPTALALVLAVGGFGAIEVGLEQTGSKRVAAITGGSICYLLAGLTYQSNALIAVVPLAALLLVRAGPEPMSHLRWMAAHLATLLASLAAGFLLMTVLFGMRIFPEAARMDFETQPFSKLLWFLWQPVANSLALFALRDRFDTGAPWFWAAALIVAAVIALGALSSAGGNQRLQKMKWLVCLLFLPLVAHAVSLASVQRAIGYRTLFALSGLVVVLVVFSVRSMHAAGWINVATHRGALTLMILLAAIVANRNSFTLIAEPQGREWTIVRDAAQRLALNAHTAVYIITPSVEDRSTRRVFADEFGSLSTNSDWVPREMFFMAMRERFPNGPPAGSSYTVTVGARAPTAKAYDVVIDMRTLKEHRVD